MIEFLRKCYHKYRELTAPKPPRYFSIDGFDMDLGDGHRLAFTMRDHPMYDRFVPFLAELADKVNGQYIIDIGANVGDTTAAMLKHTNKNVICVEPTNKFYDLLVKNIHSMSAEFSKRVRIVKAYIAQDADEKYYSEIVDGTAIKQQIDGLTENRGGGRKSYLYCKSVVS